MLNDYLDIVFAFALDGMRTCFAIAVGWFASLFLPERLRKRLHPKEFWQRNELTFNKIVAWFVLGVLLLSAFYALIDPAALGVNDTITY